MQHTDSSKPEVMRDTLSSCRGAPVVSGVKVDVEVGVEMWMPKIYNRGVVGGLGGLPESRALHTLTESKRRH